MTEPRRFEIGGSQLRCMHCRHDTFTGASVLLNTPGMTFLGLEWLNDSARVLACVNCGFLHWFAKGATTSQRELHEVTCLSCGAALPPATDTCRKCGWSYGDQGSAGA